MHHFSSSYFVCGELDLEQGCLLRLNTLIVLQYTENVVALAIDSQNSHVMLLIIGRRWSDNKAVERGDGGGKDLTCQM